MHTFTTPFKFANGIAQKNRTVLAPMTNSQSHEDGSMSEAELHWLALRAEGGFGMLISAASHVQPEGRAWAGQIGCFSESHLPGLRRLAELGRKHEALTILQLFHGGVRSPSEITGAQPTAPSAVTLDFPNFQMPRALEDREIEEIIENFVAAGVRAHRAGLSGVEVHGANGYLFTQFLSKMNNTRNDRWGGALDNRARMLTETVKRLRAKVPPEFVLGVRLLAEDAPAQKGFAIDETLQVIGWLTALGVNYVHISSQDVVATSWQHAEARETNLRRVRAGLPAGVALIASGGVTTAERADFAMSEGADLVAIGKAAISTPDWPLKAAQPGFHPAPFPLSPTQATSLGISPPFQRMLSGYGLIKAT